MEFSALWKRGCSKHETFGQRLARDMVKWGREQNTRDEIVDLARSGSVDEAVNEAQRLDSALETAICLKDIATEQAVSRDFEAACSTARLIRRSLEQADAYTQIAEQQNQQGDSQGACVSLADAIVAAKRVSDRGWRAMTLAKVAVVQLNAGASQDAKATCRLALKAAIPLRAEQRDQPLTRIINVMCRCGELEGAAATLKLLNAIGSLAHAKCYLAIALFEEGSAEDGLALLADVGPGWRFDAVRSIGERFAVAEEARQLESLCGNLATLDKLGLLVGKASFLQDSGRFREALAPQQLALGLAQQLQEPPPAPRASASDIAADLALNLARTGQYDSAINCIELIVEPRERARILRDICVYQAEAGEVDAARDRTELLSETRDQTQAISSIAAVLGADGHRRMAEELLSESIQLARRIKDPFDRDLSFLWITTAAMMAHVYTAAGAAASMIRDADTRQTAGRIIDHA